MRIPNIQIVNIETVQHTFLIYFVKSHRKLFQGNDIKTIKNKAKQNKIKLGKYTIFRVLSIDSTEPKCL